MRVTATCLERHRICPRTQNKFSTGNVSLRWNRQVQTPVVWFLPDR